MGSLVGSTPTPKRVTRGPERDPPEGCGGPEPLSKGLKGAEWRARRNLSV